MCDLLTELNLDRADRDDLNERRRILGQEIAAAEAGLTALKMKKTLLDRYLQQLTPGTAVDKHALGR